MEIRLLNERGGPVSAWIEADGWCVRGVPVVTPSRVRSIEVRGVVALAVSLVVGAGGSVDVDLGSLSVEQGEGR